MISLFYDHDNRFIVEVFALEMLKHKHISKLLLLLFAMNDVWKAGRL